MWRISVARHFQIFSYNSNIITRQPSNSTFLQRLVSNDVRLKENSAYNADQNIHEVFSLDDFGLLSRSINDTVNNVEKSFIDKILNKDALSVSIPTTIDSEKLGGVNEVMDFDHVVEMLNEVEYDIEPMEEEMCPLLMPNIDEITLKRERELNLSTMGSHLSIFPSDLPLESFTSQLNLIKEEKQHVEVTEELLNDFCIETLEALVKKEDKDGVIQNLLSTNWLDTSLNRGLIYRVNKVFRYVSLHVNVETLENILSKFGSNIFATISDDVLITLATKKFESERNNENVVEYLNYLTNLCTSRDLRQNTKMTNKSLHAFYETILKNSDEKIAFSAFHECTRLGFDKSTDVFMKSYSAHLCSISTNFEKTFNLWKKVSLKYGTTSGVEHFWDLAISDLEDYAVKKIRLLLNHSSRTDHPFSTMANLIMSFIRLNKLSHAIEVYRTVSVSGRYFKKHLQLFAEMDDVECIERMALLIETGLIAENRRSTKNHNHMEKLLGEEFHKTLETFYGVSRRAEDVAHSKKSRKSIHRVDQQQLYEICRDLQKAWLGCALKMNDVECANRLRGWCTRNSVDIDGKVMKKLDSLV